MRFDHHSGSRCRKTGVYLTVDEVECAQECAMRKDFANIALIEISMTISLFQVHVVLVFKINVALQISGNRKFCQYVQPNKISHTSDVQIDGE
jgi:hypothetical protein